MQKGRVVSLKNYALSEFLRKNYILLISLLFLILGIIFGVLRFGQREALSGYFNEYITKFIGERSGQSFTRIFFTSYFSSLAVLFLLFLLGASLFGIITLPAAMMLRGVFQGGISAFLYARYGLKGIAFNAVIFIPSTFIFLIIMLLASREAIRFSIKISNLTLSKTLPQNLSCDFKEYSIRFLIFASFTVCAALVDAMLSKGLINNFTLT